MTVAYGHHWEGNGGEWERIDYAVGDPVVIDEFEDLPHPHVLTVVTEVREGRGRIGVRHPITLETVLLRTANVQPVGLWRERRLKYGP